jgi:hypothetical protein
MFDPVYSNNFWRSRAGRWCARSILMLNFGVLGWTITAHPKGLLWALLPLPLFVRWGRLRRRPSDAGLEESFVPPCPIPGPSLTVASQPRRDFEPPPSPPA